MNKKIYQKPTMEVTMLTLETPLLAGSKNAVNAVLDNDAPINEGTVDARPHNGIWE